MTIRILPPVCRKAYPWYAITTYQWYTRRERDGLVLGAYEANPQTWSVDGVPKPILAWNCFDPELDRVAHLMADAMDRIPALNEAGIKTTVHGPGELLRRWPAADRPGARDCVMPGWPAAAGSVSARAPGAGKLLAEWIVEGQPPMHMGVFDPRRFGDYADRQYRLDRAKEVFALQFATHYPLEEREAGRPAKTTPVYQRLADAGARFGCVQGWERANWFAIDGEQHRLSFHRTAWFDAVAREVQGVTTHAGVIDLSAFSKLLVTGSDAALFFDGLTANRPPRKPGEIRLCHCLNPKATVECEFTMTLLDDGVYYLVYAAAAEQHHLDWLASHVSPDLDVVIENVTGSRGVLGLAGPGSRQILSQLTPEPLSNRDFPWLTARRIEVAGHTVIAMRVSYTGESGWELHHDMADQAAIYDALKSVTSVVPPVDFGFYAMNSMRMEKAFRAWGVELTVENTPWECGLDRFIALNDRDFVGRQALIAQRDQGLTQRLIYAEVESGDTDIIGGEAVFCGGNRVGVAVSGAFGHRVGKCLAFLLISSPIDSETEELTVEVLGQRCAVKPIPEPAHDPESLLPRA